MTGHAPLLSVSGLAWAPSSRPQSPVLRDASLSLERGELLVIVGASGSGKTSLLRCLNALNEPCSGTIILDGVDVREMPAPDLRRQVAFIAQTPYMFEGTVADNLHRAAAYMRVTCDEPQLHAALTGAGLATELLARTARELSIGQQQRVAFARATIGGPRVVLCDEPTASLDQAARMRVEETINALRVGGTAVVLVTHDMTQAARMGDRLLELRDGRLTPHRATQVRDGAGA